MGRAKSGMEQIAIWVPVETLEKSEEMVPRLKASDFGALLGKATRSDVLRLAVVRGLTALDIELPGPDTSKPKKRGKPGGGASNG